MTYEEMISIFAGWTGTSVIVSVQDLATSGTVMTATGVFCFADVEDSATPDERLMIMIGPESSTELTELTIERSVFCCAAGDDRYLEVILGGNRVYMTAREAVLDIGPLD